MIKIKRDKIVSIELCKNTLTVNIKVCNGDRYPIYFETIEQCKAYIKRVEACKEEFFDPYNF